MGVQRHERDAVPSAWRGRVVAGHRLWERLYLAVGARNGAEAGTGGAIRDWSESQAALAAVVDRVAAIGVDRRGGRGPTFLRHSGRYSIAAAPLCIRAGSRHP